MQRQRFETRLHEAEPWETACKYMGWFAVECKYTPDQVFDMPWPQLLQLTMVADDMADQHRSQQTQKQLSERQARRMV